MQDDIRSDFVALTWDAPLYCPDASRPRADTPLSLDPRVRTARTVRGAFGARLLFGMGGLPAYDGGASILVGIVLRRARFDVGMKYWIPRTHVVETFPRVGSGLRWSASPRMGLWFRIDGSVVLLRPRFEIIAAGEVFRAGILAVQTAVGLEFRFP